MTGGQVLAALVALVVVWERRCHRSGQLEHLISRVVDRLRARHRVIRWFVNYVVVATALHLLRWVPARFDVYQAMRWTRR
ncbi:DUF7427 family protein [Gordonia malaquae]|uniref:DUF7427 family protein n=1 Tax=Gordonia malaquae TaxID=410332 RepID=UPI00301914A8